MSEGNGGGRLLDFNSAYSRMHGGARPRPERMRVREVAVEAIAGAARGSLKSVVATIDLEDDAFPGLLVRNVREGDAVVAKAGKAAFAAVFTGLDAHGRLAFMVFNNGRYEGEHEIAPGETEKVWGGMLMDFSTFAVRLRSLQLHSADGRVLGCVEISAEVEAQAAF